MRAFWLGRVEFVTAWHLQRELASLREERRVEDILLLLEHPPTITLGRRAEVAHVLASRERLEQRGIALHSIDRGGDVTYHGPGQLVGYPIFHLAHHGKDLHRFLRQMEEALIQALAEFGASARRFPPHTGVWVGEKKIAAIGIKVSRWVSTHGFALNVATDLHHFDLIVPCGIRGHGVTSLNQAAGRPVTLMEVVPSVVRAFHALFPFHDTPRPFPPEALSENSRKILASALDVTEPL